MLGLVGFGRIGIATARRAHHGFGMKIAYYGRREALPDVAASSMRGSIRPERLLGSLRFRLAAHPRRAETQGLIGAEALAAMKPGSYLINTARGGMIDHAALADALRSGHLAGAGLDVFPAEPRCPKNCSASKTSSSCHTSAAQPRNPHRDGQRALANIVAWAEGRPLPDRVA